MNRPILEGRDESKGSAKVSDVHPCLRLRLPLTFCRLPHGKLKFTLDLKNITRYLELAPAWINMMRQR
ncbi:MAG: hypothetical protein ABSF91_16215, partial [Bacteroidota bacterium]